MKTKSPYLYCILLLSLAASVFADSKPNVLFIAIDDLKPSLGCYYYPQVKTPHIDKLASEGVLFTRAYANVPTCGASRASLLSGLSPTATRFTNVKSSIQKETPDAVPLQRAFKEGGYTTISNGKVAHGWDRDEDWSEKPFRRTKKVLHLDAQLKETFAGEKLLLTEAADVDDFTYFDGKVLEKSLKDLRKLKQSGEPFFLACGFYKPHLPLYAPKRYWDLYERDEIEIADNRYFPRDGFNRYKANPRGTDNTVEYDLGGIERGSEDHHRLVRHGYYACVSYIDRLVGYLLEELDTLGLADNTIVVLWGDHGHFLGEHELFGKHKTLDGAVRIPLIVRHPQAPQGQVTSALIESIDLYPTLVELAGISAPENQLQGHSFASLLKDPRAEIRDSVYTRFQNADTVITERYSYTRFGTGEEMLFDYHRDPQENQNEGANPEYRDVLVNMQQLLDQRIKESLQK
jgi:arylsulfatase A-like enzyme